MSFRLRPARPEDAEVAAEVVNALDAAHVEVPDVQTANDLREWWARGDAVIVAEEARRIVGVATVRRRPAALDVDGYVHPESTGRGIGTALLDWGEGQARERGFAAARTPVLAADASAVHLVRGRGYEYIRSFYRMMIELEGPPPEAEWPGGFELAVMQPGEERTVHAALEEAFADHWEHHPRSYEEWARGDRFESGLTFLVRDGDQVAAAAVCREEKFGMGFVDILGVRRPWRRRGLARALLLHAFGELRRRGQNRISLGVDASNATGAVALYESVGMHPASRVDLYEKRLS